jgi:glycosyltransferase involved in cell wall biosynthesis
VSQFAVRFLNVSELGPRKNLVGLLRTWLRATSREDDAVLIVKVGCYAPGWRLKFARQVEQVEDQVGKRLQQAAPVCFVYDLFSDAQMPRLYAAATHYISLSHGEGWDQTMVEAAASGLKLIAPNHSAYTAYLDTSVARLISSREVPAVWPDGDQTGLLFQGANWWEADEVEAVAYVRAAVEGRDQGQASPRDRVVRELSWERAARRLIDLLSEVEVNYRSPPFGRLRRWYRRA